MLARRSRPVTKAGSSTLGARLPGAPAWRALSSASLVCGAALALAIPLGGCIGNIGGADETQAAADTPPPGTVEGFSPAASGIRLLSIRQYQNTIRDLLGDDLAVDTSGLSDIDVTLHHGLTEIGGSVEPYVERAIEQFEANALELARQIFADTGRREALVGCVPSAPDDACVEEFLVGFSRRALRRPASEDELAQLRALVAAGTAELGDTWAGLEFALVALLQSPSLLYRVELGEPIPEQEGSRRYSSWEMATRLSYLLWASTPDDELLDAAQSDALLTVEGLRAQATRMLGDARARSALLGFFDEHLELRKLGGLAKDETMYPQMSGTLMESMHTEIELLLEDLIFEQDADIREIFVTQRTFVNAELAALYGLEAPADGFAEVEIPAEWDRGGFLTLGAALVAGGNEKFTSPTLRGKFIRVKLLCDAIPPPPPDVEAALPPPPDGELQTMRERLAAHMINDSCRGCHLMMDPLGLAYEHFDSIGAHRPDDQGLTIDPSGELDGAPFANAKELNALLRADPRVPACFTRQIYRHATGHLDEKGERVVLDGLAGRFASSGSFRDLMLELVQSDGFRYAGEPR
jgi:hypothetical protein